MKNKLLLLSLLLLLALPVISIEETDLTETTTNLETIENMPATEAEKEELPSKDDLPLPYKEPINKKQLIKKFLIAMMCVGGASVLLYATLSLYNKLRDNFSYDNTSFQDNDSPLNTPQDLSEAVSSFIEKTRWQ